MATTSWRRRTGSSSCIPMGSDPGAAKTGSAPGTEGSAAEPPRNGWMWDDVSFLVQLVQQLSEEHAIDPDRVYATGHSNGMIMSYRLVCEAADVFVAAVGQAGTLGVDVCAPSQPVSLLHIHGEADTNLPIDGGPGDRDLADRFPVATRWHPDARGGRRMRCRPCGFLRSPQSPPRPGPVAKRATTIELVTVAGASHAWMGAHAYTLPGAPEPFIDYDSSLASWTFLAAHPRSG